MPTSEKVAEHIRTENARQAWPRSITWRLDTLSSMIFENMEFSLFSHTIRADNAAGCSLRVVCFFILEDI